MERNKAIAASTLLDCILTGEKELRRLVGLCLQAGRCPDWEEAQAIQTEQELLDKFNKQLEEL